MENRPLLLLNHQPAARLSKSESPFAVARQTCGKLVACGALLFSRKKNLKGALVVAFFGALLGLFLVAASNL